MEYKISQFLVVDTQLYKRLCPSVGLLVGLSVVTLVLKTRIYDAVVVILCAWM